MDVTDQDERLLERSNYIAKKKWEPFYTGGSVQTSLNDAHIITTCGDQVKFVDATNGDCEKSISLDGDDLTCFTVSPDKTKLITATKSLLLKQWDIDSQTCTRTWKAIHISPVLCMDVEKTSTLLATGGSDGTVKIWDLINQYCTHNLKIPTTTVNLVKFHAADLVLFTASSDYVIRIWSLLTSKCVKMLNGHVSAVTSLLFPSSDLLLTSGKDKVVLFWNIEGDDYSQVSDQPAKTITTFESVECAQLVDPEDIDPKEFQFLTCGDKGAVKVWSSSSGKSTKQISLCDPDAKETVSLINLVPLPNRKELAVVTSDFSFDILDAETLSEARKFSGHTDEIIDVKLLGEKESHIVVASNSQHLKLFSTSSFQYTLLKGHTDEVSCVAVFKDQLTFISGSKDGLVILWKLDEANSKADIIATNKGHSGSLLSLAVSQTSTSFFISGSQDSIMKIWSISSKNELKNDASIMAHDMAINSIGVAPNDKLVATGSQDKLVKLWNHKTKECIATFRGHKKSIWCVQFSPLDKIVASSSADGSIRLWSVGNLSCIRTIEGHDCSVLQLNFTKKGTQIVSSGSDGIVKVWDVKSSECLQTLDEHSDKVWSVCSNQTGNVVITGSSDSTVRIWEDVSEETLQENIEKSENVIKMHEELQNLLHDKKIEKALKLAIKLEQPATALRVIKQLPCDSELLENAIGSLSVNKASVLLNFITQWNVNSQNCHEAQALLKYLLSNFSPEEIMTFKDVIPDITALISYTERHFKRISKLAQEVKFLDYTWHRIKLKN